MGSPETMISPEVEVSETYDQAHPLRQFTRGSRTTRFAYNGDGVRVGKTTGAATTDYLVDLATTLPVVISDTDAIPAQLNVGLGDRTATATRRLSINLAATLRRL